jgi:hypothetical protein
VDSVYWNGKLVHFIAQKPPRRQLNFALGPWRYGMRLLDGKPNDHRPNLYLVAPGNEYSTPGWEEYRHNAVINLLPLERKVTNWDVYWAVILDPQFDTDIHSEHDLLVAVQEYFVPAAKMKFDQIPGHAILRDYLKIRSIRDLRRFRTRDGRLPRVIIQPAHVALRALVEEDETHTATSPH